jgi:uncharacterized membrane protein YcaP (DUF421 family)
MEIVVRAAILWAFVLLVMRALGRKELAQISPFEFVLLVVVGDLIQQGVTEQDTSVTAAMLAVATLALLTIALSYISFRFQSTSRVVEGIPVVIIREGSLLRQVLRIERLSVEEVSDAAREQGIEDLRQVRWGVLEADGTFSFVRFEEPTPAQERSGKKEVE